MKILTFTLILLLPLLSFSQQSLTKEPVKKNASNAVVLKKQISTKAIHSQRANSIYSNEYRIINNVPQNFPKYVNTGNPKLDTDNYYKAKQLWIKNNPEQFEKIKHLAL